MTTVTQEVQNLEPGAIVELYQLDATSIGGDQLFFHGHDGVGPIWWQNVQYDPWPIQSEGFSRASDKQNTPRLSVGNVDGSITRLCLEFDDLVGARLVRIRTFGQFLDERNFRGPNVVIVPYTLVIDQNGNGVVALSEVEPGATYEVMFNVTALDPVLGIGVKIANGTPYGPITTVGTQIVELVAGTGPASLQFVGWTEGEQTVSAEEITVRKILTNPSANPNEEFPREIWFIDRKSVEDNEQVQFELASAFDLRGVKLPRRQVIANYCSWKSMGGYRGVYCQYNGPPVAKKDGTPTTDPALDDCGGKLSDCKLREWPDDVMNFGGFPAAGLMRT